MSFRLFCGFAQNSNCMWVGVKNPYNVDITHYITAIEGLLKYATFPKFCEAGTYWLVCKFRNKTMKNCWKEHPYEYWGTNTETGSDAMSSREPCRWLWKFLECLKQIQNLISVTKFYNEILILVNKNSSGFAFHYLFRRINKHQKGISRMQSNS